MSGACRNTGRSDARTEVRLPEKGDTVTAHGVRFTVEEIEGHRIDKIKVRLHG